MHNKITQLQNILSLSNCDICALTEIWLNDTVLHSERFSDVVNEFSLKQLNKTPYNDKGNLLDLMFTNSPEFFSDIAKYPA